MFVGVARAAKHASLRNVDHDGYRGVLLIDCIARCQAVRGGLLRRYARCALRRDAPDLRDGDLGRVQNAPRKLRGLADVDSGRIGYKEQSICTRSSARVLMRTRADACNPLSFRTVRRNV